MCPSSHLEAVFAKERADGRFPDPAKQERWESMTRDFLSIRKYSYKDMDHWMEKQTYMAMGMTMMAAAELGVEAMPLEGFDPISVDKAFNIRATGYTTTVLLALGYPDPAKAYKTRCRGSSPTGCSPSSEPRTRRLHGAGSIGIGVRPHAPAPPARERRVHQHEHPGG